MCPHGYHHSGSMATPALGTRDVRLSGLSFFVRFYLVYIYIYIYQEKKYIYIYPAPRYIYIYIYIPSSQISGLFIIPLNPEV